MGYLGVLGISGFVGLGFFRGRGGVEIWGAEVGLGLGDCRVLRIRIDFGFGGCCSSTGC